MNQEVGPHYSLNLLAFMLNLFLFTLSLQL